MLELERERGLRLKRKSPVSREICGEVVELWKKKKRNLKKKTKCGRDLQPKPPVTYPSVLMAPAI